MPKSGIKYDAEADDKHESIEEDSSFEANDINAESSPAAKAQFKEGPSDGGKKDDEEQHAQKEPSCCDQKVMPGEDGQSQNLLMAQEGVLKPRVNITLALVEASATNTEQGCKQTC